MNDLNQVTVSGVLDAEPDLRRTKAGIAVANLAIVVDDGTDSFILDAAVWADAAVLVAEHKHAGDPITISGKLVLDEWERDGDVRRKLKVHVGWWR